MTSSWQDLTEDQLTLVQVMGGCCQTTWHYLNLCKPRSVLSYHVTRPHWVNHIFCWWIRVMKLSLISNVFTSFIHMTWVRIQSLVLCCLLGITIFFQNSWDVFFIGRSHGKGGSAHWWCNPLPYIVSTVFLVDCSLSQLLFSNGDITVLIT